MKKQITLKVLLSAIIVIIVFTFPGCSLFSDDDFIAWTHVVSAANYTDKGTYAVYRIIDERFNTLDWYDVWMNDAYWDPKLGWSSFEGVYDPADGRFYFEPEYYDGYTEWNAYTDTDIIGATLRFYRRTYPEGSDGLSD